MKKSELKLSYIRHYFGNYLVKVTEKELKHFLEAFKEDAPVYYLKGKRAELLKAGFAFLSYSQNYKEYLNIRGYDLIEFFLNHTETQASPTFYDIKEKNLIIYHLKGTTANNRMISLIQHVASFRSMENKKTLILSEDDILSDIQDGETKIRNLAQEEDVSIDSF